MKLSFFFKIIGFLKYLNNSCLIRIRKFNFDKKISLFYFTKTPFWIKWIYKSCIWKIPSKDKSIYLTFDDGPHPLITNFVLDELKKYNAKATFFCIGKNAVLYPAVYKRIIEEGHAVGNHTYSHLNGWKTSDSEYLDDINKAALIIDSKLFRPPYGRITKFQLSQLSKNRFNFKTIMWSILSGDFDNNITKEQCCESVLKNATPGSIVVFHDSEKANDRMSYALPLVLQQLSENGFQFNKIV